MENEIIQELNQKYQNRPFLTLEEVAEVLGCSKKVVYNWTRRTDPKKRPPRLTIGKTVRFPKVAFVQWLIEQQNKL